MVAALSIRWLGPVLAAGAMALAGPSVLAQSEAADATAPSAESVRPASAPAPERSPSELPSAEPGSGGLRDRHEPRIERRVFEDEGVRIEELRVRGQVVRVTVHSKVAGAPPYEVRVGPGGRDPSQERDRAGQSAWRLFSF